MENRVTTSKVTIKCNDLPNQGRAIARTNHEPKNQRQAIRFSEHVLALHGWILGRTGMGKSSFQVALARALLSGRDAAGSPGMMILDPKRSLIDAILAILPEHRAQDLMVIDPGNKKYLPPSINLLVCPDWTTPADHATVLANIMSKRFATGWGPRMAPLFHRSLLALILANKRLTRAGQSPRYTLFDLSSSGFLAPGDSAFAHRREEVLSHLRGDHRCTHVVDYWDAFGALSPKEQESRVQPIINKIAALDTPAIRALFGRPHCDLDFMDFLKSGKVVLVNLSKAVFKGDSGSIFGTILLALVLQAAIVRYDENRSARQQWELRQFALLVDEVQNFLCPEMEEILNEGRAYACPLWIAHQETTQITDASMRGAIENAGTHVYFGLTRTDARSLSADLGPPFSRETLSEMPKYNFLATTPDFRVTGETFPLPDGDFLRSEKLREISESSYLHSQPQYLADKESWQSPGGMQDGDADAAPPNLPELPDDLEPEEPDEPDNG